MDNSTSLFVLFLGLNHVHKSNKSLDKQKKILHHRSSISNSKIRITNFMLVTSMYDNLDFKSHFRLTRSSIEVSRIVIAIMNLN